MTDRSDLGKIKGVYGVSPVFLQRATVVSLLSFVFFLLMMFGFYVRQNIGYFLLATAFLAVNVLTLVGWIAIRKKTVQIFENGIRYREFRARWEEIRFVKRTVVSKMMGGERQSAVIEKHDGQRVEIPDALDRIGDIVAIIESGVERVAANEPESR